jgi:ribosomal protein S8E
VVVRSPELKASFFLDILGVKKNPQSPLYTQLGVITKGTIIEVLLQMRVDMKSSCLMGLTDVIWMMFGWWLLLLLDTGECQ